jgi:O-methyltransferase
VPTSLTMNYNNLIAEFPIISDQISASALSVLLRELNATLDRQVEGDIVEFGCYIGTSCLFLRRLLDSREESGKRQLHAYDSFEGLPAKTTPDQSGVGLEFQAGQLSVSKKQFLLEFHRANVSPPRVHKAWFKDLTPEAIPDVIAFAFLDGDFYESILTSLELVWPRLAPLGRITIDDYDREALPGVTRAVQKFFSGKHPWIHHEHNIAIIQKAAS